MSCSHLLPQHSQTDWFQRNAAACLEMFDLFGPHGSSSITINSLRASSKRLRPISSTRVFEGITASGPPLPVLLRAIRRLLRG